jgi:hypothetical protein
VNAETLAPGMLAALLEATAAGMLADTAAAGLIIAHGHFLNDPAFRKIIAVLLIAASIAEGTPVSLRDCLGSLDRRNIALVAGAITAANG